MYNSNRHIGVNSRENETIAVDIVRILRVEGHELVEQDMGGRGQAYEQMRQYCMLPMCYQRMTTYPWAHPGGRCLP